MNILYDEDENGSFFQLYSRPWGDELFFEIVQRDDGYEGYGAANAPFRVAAQKRDLAWPSASGGLACLVSSKEGKEKDQR